MTCLSRLIAVLLAGGVLSAQPTPIANTEAERARQLLNSARWVDKTWGAFLAGRLHLDDLNRVLIEQFRSARGLSDLPSYTEEHAFLTALFDAAIEAGIIVPPALLEPFEEQWADPVLILLARDKASEKPLLRFRGEKSRDAVWLAANNLLFERRSQLGYAATLPEISITHRFTVTDADEGSFAGGQGGGICGDGVAAMPKGFPPVSIYTLQYGGSAQRGSVLLARGPQDIYYGRTVIPTDTQVGFGLCSSALDRMAAELDTWRGFGLGPSRRQNSYSIARRRSATPASRNSSAKSTEAWKRRNGAFETSSWTLKRAG